MKNTLIAILAVLIMSTAVMAEEVSVTKNGKKFHKAQCVFIKDRQTITINDKEALAKGLKPCGKCMKVEDKLTQKK